MFIASLFLLCPQVSPDGGAWDETWLHLGAVADERLGLGVAAGADVNGDGVDDWAYTRSYYQSSSNFQVSILIRSGADNRYLAAHDLSKAYGKFGSALAFGDDYNADGVPDLIAGAEEYCFLLSGADGTVIHSLLRPSAMRNSSDFGTVAIPVADADGDGVGDVLVGAPRADATNRIPGQGSIVLFSGATGDQLMEVRGKWSYPHFGSALAEGDDYDGDGRADWIVAAYLDDSASTKDAGSIQVVSSRTGQRLRKVFGPAGNRHTGAALAMVDDLDGDGRREIAATSCSSIGLGEVLIFGSERGQLIRQQQGFEFQLADDAALASAPDVDGDGVHELLIGDSRARNPQMGRSDGAIYVYSVGSDRMLQSIYGRQRDDMGSSFAVLETAQEFSILAGVPDWFRSGGFNFGGVRRFDVTDGIELGATQYALSSGGPLSIDLEFALEARDMDYQILFSLAGTGPTRVGIWIPLGNDSLLRASAVGQLPKYAQSGLRGELDGQAEASISFDLSRVLGPQWAGRTVYLAAVAFETAGEPLFASKAVALDILP